VSDKGLHNEAEFSYQEEWGRGGVEVDDDDDYSDCDANYDCDDDDPYHNGDDPCHNSDKEEEFQESFRLNQLGLLSQYAGTHKFPIALMYDDDDDDDDDGEADPSYPDYTRSQTRGE